MPKIDLSIPLVALLAIALHASPAAADDALPAAARAQQPAVIEAFGLAGWGYHARDEYIEIDSIVPRLYLSTRLLSDLGAGK